MLTVELLQILQLKKAEENLGENITLLSKRKFIMQHKVWNVQLYLTINSISLSDPSKSTFTPGSAAHVPAHFSPRLEPLLQKQLPSIHVLSDTQPTQESSFLQWICWTHLPSWLAHLPFARIMAYSSSSWAPATFLIYRKSQTTTLSWNAQKKRIKKQFSRKINAEKHRRKI